MSSRERATGFTLVELLVVIAIIGILVALLLPAVQAAREASRRVQCQNHLKQLGVACQAHHDVYQMLPRAGSDGPDITCCAANERSGWTWLFYITPYLEQNAVFEELDDNVVALSVIKTYFCPSRRPPALYGGSGRCDYAGNGGSTTGNLGKDGAFLRQWSSLPKPLGTKPDQQRTLADFTDGTSLTLLASEKQLHRTVWGTAGGDNERWNNSGWSGDVDMVRFGSELPRPDREHPDSSQPTFWSNRFGSSHPTGLNTVRVDGSVAFVSFDVTATTWLRFCTIADGEALPSGF